MPKRTRRRTNNLPATDASRTHQRLVLEAARLLQSDPAMPLDRAKRKALQRLGLPETFPLPRNVDVYNQLLAFGPELSGALRSTRTAVLETARSAMTLLAPFQPRLLGSLAEGQFHPDPRSVLLRVTAELPEDISLFLEESGIPHTLGSRRLRQGNKAETAIELPCCQFLAGEQKVDIIIVSPVQARQTLINPYTDSPYQLARPEDLAPAD